MKINNIKEMNDLLRARRIELKFAQHQVAKKININQAPYSHKESSKVMFTLAELIQLSDMLDFNILIDNKEILTEDDFLKIIIDTRKDNKISQNVASQIAGLKSHPSYNQKEKGKTSFKLDELLNLCNYFEIEVDIKLNIQEVTTVE